MSCKQTTLPPIVVSDVQPSWLQALVTLELWLGRIRQRRDLSLLDDWQLRDVGITRRQAMDEAAKPFWEP